MFALFTTGDRVIQFVILSGAKDPYSPPISKANTISNTIYHQRHFNMDSSISPSIKLGVNARMTIRRTLKENKPSSVGVDFSSVIDRRAGGRK